MNHPLGLLALDMEYEMCGRGQVTHTFTAGGGDEQREYELVGVGDIKWLLDVINFAADEAEKMGCTLDEVDALILTKEVMPEGFDHITDVLIIGGGIPDAHAMIVGTTGNRRLVRRKT